jgi:hypothetical protein
VGIGRGNAQGGGGEISQHGFFGVCVNDVKGARKKVGRELVCVGIETDERQNTNTFSIFSELTEFFGRLEFHLPMPFYWLWSRTKFMLPYLPKAK